MQTNFNNCIKFNVNLKYTVFYFTGHYSDKLLKLSTFFANYELLNFCCKIIKSHGKCLLLHRFTVRNKKEFKD